MMHLAVGGRRRADELAGVVAVPTSHHHDRVAFGQQRGESALPSFRGLANSVDETHVAVRVGCADRLDQSLHVRDRLGRLRNDSQLRSTWNSRKIAHRLHDNGSGKIADQTVHFHVPRFADDDRKVAEIDEHFELVVRMLCAVDDDVVCQLATPGKSDAQLSSFSQFDPFVRQFFTDRESALAAARWSDLDFIGAHQEMLGRDLGHFFGPDLGTQQLDLAHVGDHFLARIDRPAAVIRTTFTGHVGDPGMPTSVYYLYAEGKSRQSLPVDEEAYRAVMSSRSVLTCVTNRAIGDESVSPGMAMGLDHRELLPPFFPVLHAEDYVFGATVWQCCPDTIAGHLPIAVLHEPPPGKPVILLDDLSRDRRALVFEFAHIMRRIVLDDFEPAENATAAERMQALGRQLVERASLPAADFIEYMRTQTLLYESSKMAYLGEQLRDAPDAAPCWRRDVETYIDHCRLAVTFDDFDIPFDLKGLGSAAEIRVLMFSWNWLEPANS